MRVLLSALCNGGSSFQNARLEVKLKMWMLEE
jgi:hypothetical protein